MTYAIPIFNFFHISITAIIPLIILMCFVIKIFEKSHKNTMLFIMLSFTMIKIVFSILFSRSHQILSNEMSRWSSVDLLENGVVALLIVITVILILFDKYRTAIASILLMLLLSVIVDFYIWQTNIAENSMHYIPEYSCIGIENEEMTDVLKVNEYILQKEKEGYNVYILDIIASKYMIPLHRNNYKFDLMLNGNLGYSGEEKLIEEIKSIENLLILRQKPEIETIDIQQPKEIDKFIEENYEKIGEINNLEIYN